MIGRRDRSEIERDRANVGRELDRLSDQFYVTQGRAALATLTARRGALRTRQAELTLELAGRSVNGRRPFVSPLGAPVSSAARDTRLRALLNRR